MPGETHTLADFSAGLRFEASDRRLADRFKIHLLDAIGCGLQGHPCPGR